MKQMKTNFEVLHNLQQPEILQIVIDSIIQGYTDAQVYVDDLINPTVSLIWEGYSIIFGGEMDRAKEALAFMREELLTDEARVAYGFIKLYAPTPEWEELLVEELAEFKAKRLDRVFFRHELKELPIWEKTDPQLELKEIDREVLESDLVYLPGLIGEIHEMWGSVENFLKHGFGVCAIKGQEIAGWCTGEYLSQNDCGLGIETVETYQQQGIATLTAIACVQKAAELKLTPHWDSWLRNVPSVKVAEKVGFTRVQEYHVVGLLLVDE